MRRRQFISLIGVAAVASALAPLAAGAQQSGQVRRVGVIMTLAPSDPEVQLRTRALEAGLREHGWVEGRNLRLEYRWIGDASRLRAQASELVGLAPDVILAVGTPVMTGLLAVSRNVPVVFAQVTDPVGSGFVPSFARPGGHVTGVTLVEFSIGSKWLEALKEIAPTVRRVAVVFNPDTAPFAPLFWQPVVATASRSFAVEPMQMPVRDAAGLAGEIEAFARESGGGLMVLPDASMVNNRDLIIALAARHRLPAIYPFRYFATSGGLLSYGNDVGDALRRAASYVDRILKGAKPGDLPVQAPVKYELVINLKTARVLGLEVPPLMLARADEVIE
ncbi:MAG TPA: ABC transporter substrate-binding protein [Xanthobacteraceae bacterium]|nr:ABC transporter substrate-binding protein [Xanthobacteraceae bacterium]